MKKTILLTAMLLALFITQEAIANHTVSENFEEMDKDSTKSNWNVGFDITVNSRFIWRGLVLGDHPNAQASVTFSNGGFFAGVWSSYPMAIGSAGSNYKEIIPYIGYGGALGDNSNLTVMVLPHYDPNVGGFFKFDNDGATNRLELRAVYNVGKLDFFAGWDFYNSFPGSDSPLYLEMGYTIDMPNGVSVRPFISGSPNDNYYTVDGGADVTQMGWYTSKSYSISKDVGLTLKADMVYNPDRQEFNAAFNAIIKL